MKCCQMVPLWGFKALPFALSSPQELIEALRKLGYRVDTPNNKLPALFFGKGPVRGSVTVSVEDRLSG